MNSCWNQKLTSLLGMFALAMLLPLNTAWSADEAPSTAGHEKTAEHEEAAAHATDDNAHGDGADHAHEDKAYAGHGEGEHHGEGDHGEGDHGDGHHTEYSFFGDLSFWAAIAFVGFVGAIFKLGLWDSLTTNMATREKNEHSLIESADAKLAKAQSALSDYKGQIESMDETIKETLAEAERDANHTHTEIVALANKEAEASLSRARLQVGRAQDASLLEIFTTVADRVGEATEAAMRDKLSDDDQDRLIDQTLGQLSNS